MPVRMPVREMMHDANRERKTEDGLAQLFKAVQTADRFMHYEIIAHSGELEYCRNRLTEILNKVEPASHHAMRGRLRR